MLLILLYDKLCYTVFHCNIIYCSVLHSTACKYIVVLQYTVFNFAVFPNSLFQYTVIHCALLVYTVFNYNLFQCDVLNYTLFQYTSRVIISD